MKYVPHINKKLPRNTKQHTRIETAFHRKLWTDAITVKYYSRAITVDFSGNEIV